MADSTATPPSLPRRTMRAEVLRTKQLTPQMVRVVLGGDALVGFGAGEFTDHYVKLLLPPPGASYSEPFDAAEVRARLPRDEWPRTRTYTVRGWDADKVELTIDFVNHGSSGIGGPWAAAAKPGDLLQLSGPGGAYAPDPEADWHLMIGDAAVIPAISASLERIPGGVPVQALIQVDGPEEEHALDTPGDLRVSWIHDHAGDGNSGNGVLAGAVSRLEFPPGRVHAFVHGEAEAVRVIRRHLLADRGLAPEALSVSGYWKCRRTEDGWREYKPEWKRLVAEDDR